MISPDCPPHHSAPHFGRDLSPQEWRGYQSAIQEAQKLLGIKRLGLITPIRSLPTHPDTGIGSLNGAKPFLQFINQLGFDTVQLDPSGKTKLSDSSPYAGTVFSANPLYIDLTPLAHDPAWAGLLSPETLKRLIDENPNKGQNRVAYRYIFQAQETVLKEVFNNFQAKLNQVDQLPTEEAQAIRKLQQRFEQFKTKNQDWLEPDALYEALSEEYQNDYWPNWQGTSAELDKNLLTDKTSVKAQTRLQELRQRHAPTMANYQFTQFIAEEQKLDVKRFAQQNGFALMADRQVGFSDRDVWAYQALFLKDWYLGCPPDYFTANGQAWGFPVLDPEKLFKPDGSLGEGGQLLKALFAKMFEENPGGVRIDHIIGLIDPWVYPKAHSTTKHGSRLYSSPEHPQLGRYALIQENDLDLDIPPDEEARVKPETMTDEAVARYARIIDQIVLAAAKEKGISLDSIICEDLGTLTTPVKAVMQKRGFSGIRVSQFVDPDEPENIHRGKNLPSQHWLTAGTHDNAAILAWSNELFEKHPGAAQKHARQLAEDMGANPEETQKLAQEFEQNPLNLVRAKFMELFMGPAKQIQVFFADWLGLEETYNRPGTAGDENWSLRIPNNFREAYFKALESGRGFNLPRILLEVLKVKKLDETHQPLAQQLALYANKLEQPALD